MAAAFARRLAGSPARAVERNGARENVAGAGRADLRSRRVGGVETGSGEPGCSAVVVAGREDGRHASAGRAQERAARRHGSQPAEWKFTPKRC